MHNSAIWTISMPKRLEKQVLDLIKREGKMRSEFIREVLRKHIEESAHVGVQMTLSSGQATSYSPSKVTNKNQVLRILKQTAGAWAKGDETGVEYQSKVRAESEERFQRLWRDI